MAWSEPHQPSRQTYLEALVSALPVISYTEETAYIHARLWAGPEGSGNSIGAYDLIVAATALQRGSTLATFNKRHFSRVKCLKIIEPKCREAR